MRVTLQSILSLMCALFVGLVMANQAVYKCGQELTNLPKNPELCQKLEISNSTQIEGTQVQNPPSFNSASKPKEAQVEGMPGAQASSQDAHQRNTKARTILEDERHKLLKQQAELVQNHKQSQPDRQREAAFNTNLQRIERDLQALSRELARYAAPGPSAHMK
jgi:tRNA U34 5-carboxymethylaminomethyl modifying GTPase MnmE/TrmE